MQKIYKIDQQVLQKIRDIETYLDEYNDNQDADPIFYQKLVKQQSLSTPVQGLDFPVQTTESFYYTDTEGTTYYSGKGFMVKLNNEFLIIPLDSSDEQALLQNQVQDLEIEPEVPLTYNDILSSMSYPIYSGDFQIDEDDTQDKLIVFPMELEDSGDDYYPYERVIFRTDIEVDRIEIRYTNDELNQQGTYLDDIFHTTEERLFYFLEYFGVDNVDINLTFTSIGKFYTEQNNYLKYNSDLEQLDLYQYDDDPQTLDGVLPTVYFRKPQSIQIQHESELFITKKTFSKYFQLRNDLMTNFQYLGFLYPLLDAGITNPIILEDPDQYNFELKQSWDPQQQQTIEKSYYLKMNSDNCEFWLFCEPIQDYDQSKIAKLLSGEIFQNEITRPILADIQQSQQNLSIPNEDQDIETKIDEIRLETTISALKLDYGNKMEITPTDIQNKIQSMTFDEQELELIEQQSGLTVQTLKEEMQKLQIKRETSQGQTFTPEQIDEFISQIFIDNLENIVEVKFEIPEDIPDGSIREFGVKHYITGFQPETIIRETIKVNTDNKQQFSSYGNDTAIDTIDYDLGVITFLIQPKDTITLDYEYLIDIIDEPQRGSKNGFNNVFYTLNNPVYPGSFSVQTDDSLITDDGLSGLSDGGSIFYDTGQFLLTSYPLPLSTLNCTYKQVMQQKNVMPIEPPDSINKVFHQPNENIQVDTLKYKIDPRFQIDKTRPYIFDPEVDTYMDLTTVEIDIDQVTGIVTSNLPPQMQIIVNYYYTESYSDIIPDGQIDGINTIFDLLNVNIYPGTVILHINGTAILDDNSLVEDEIPSGDIDGINFLFTLSHGNIIPGSIDIISNGVNITDSSIPGEDLGLLTDNGIVDYLKGIIYLKENIPLTDLTITYRYYNGNLGAQGSINYETGIITLNEQPIQGTEILCDFNTLVNVQDSVPEIIDYESMTFTLSNTNILKNGLSLNFEGIELYPDYDEIAIYYRDRQGIFTYDTGKALLTEQPLEDITISYNYKIQLWQVQNQKLDNEKIVIPPQYSDELGNKKVQLLMYVMKSPDIDKQLIDLLGDYQAYQIDSKIQIVIPPMIFDANKYSDNNEYTLSITQSKIFGVTEYQYDKSSVKLILRDQLTDEEINRVECPLYFGFHEKQTTPQTRYLYTQNNSNFQIEIPQTLFQSFVCDSLPIEQMFYISYFYDIQQDDFYMDEDFQLQGRQQFKYVLCGFINQPGIIEPIPETMYMRLDFCNFQKLDSVGLFLEDV